jgi:hypothetical protein
MMQFAFIFIVTYNMQNTGEKGRIQLYMSIMNNYPTYSDGSCKVFVFALGW